MQINNKYIIKYQYVLSVFFCFIYTVASANNNKLMINYDCGIRVVESTANIAKCNVNIEGALVYILSSKELIRCTEHNWQRIIIAKKGKLGGKGKDGVPGIACTDIGDTNGDKSINILDCLGKDGPKGPTGPKGDPGYDGNKGARGDKGSKGNIGEKGFIGSQGISGEDGRKGPLGNQGIPGITGIKGVVGTSRTCPRI